MNRALSATLMLLAILVPGTLGRAEDRTALRSALALEEAFQEAIRKAEPSVVCILVSRADPHAARVRLEDPEYVPEAYGSGVVLGIRDGKGLILTNSHVVRGSTQLYVRLPGGKGSTARLFNNDVRSDLAILQLEKPWPVEPIKQGDADSARKGQFVLSIANPFAAGFQDGSPSVSWGIISNIRRRAPGKPPANEQDRTRTTLHHYGTLLQTDARLNLGCSGGALVNLKGEMIGLLTAQAAIVGSESAGGFAIPINARMKQIVGRLLEGREVEYGFLGVQFMRGERYVRWQQNGVMVRVIKGSPIAQALSRYSDTITIEQVDGVPVHNADELLFAIGSLLAGTKVKLTVAGFREALTVTLAKYYLPGPVVAVNRPPFVHGLRVDYTSVLFQRANWNDEIPRGVYVSEIEPAGAAEKAQLKDAIITGVNGQPVHTPAEFYRVAAQKRGPINLKLNDGKEVTLD